MLTRLLNTACLLGLALVFATCRTLGDGPNNLLENDIVVEEPDEAPLATTTPATVYLHRGGGRYTPGAANNPAQNVSRLVQTQHGSVLTFAPFAGSDADWQQAVAHARTLFRAYNVTFVETEPAAGNYIECVVTNSSGDIFRDYSSATVGASGRTCSGQRSSINFVLLGGRITRPVRIGEIIAHEVGHVLSLQHTLTTGDMMSYRRAAKAFLDRNMPCARNKSKRWVSTPCQCNITRQNSHQMLLTRLGPAPTTGVIRRPLARKL